MTQIDLFATQTQGNSDLRQDNPKSDIIYTNAIKRRLKGQELAVYEILEYWQPARTEQIKIVAMKHGISCSDRYLRWLRGKDLISCKKLKGDKTKTWYIKEK